MIWFLLWLFLSGALLYFMGWTLFILYRQKTSWRAFAAKKSLRYKSQSVMASPEMSGTIDNYVLSYFVGEHLGVDARSSRKLTAIEIKLLSKMPFSGAIANGGMVRFAQGMSLREELRPNDPKWDKNFIAATSSRLALDTYLTPERLDGMISLMKIRNAWSILVFREDTMLLRFDTPDALENKDKLEKITRKLIDLAKILELKTGEAAVLKSEAAKAPVKEVNVALEEKDFVQAKEFQLEDDAPVNVPPAPKTEET